MMAIPSVIKIQVFQKSLGGSVRKHKRIDTIFMFMFAPCINSIKNTFIVPTDAHYYKIIELLKQFKIITLSPTCFSSRRNQQQGAVPCLAKITKYGFSVFVGIDVVNVVAAYQTVVQACGVAKQRTAP